MQVWHLYIINEYTCGGLLMILFPSLLYMVCLSLYMEYVTIEHVKSKLEVRHLFTSRSLAASGAGVFPVSIFVFRRFLKRFLGGVYLMYTFMHVWPFVE